MYDEISSVIEPSASVKPGRIDFIVLLLSFQTTLLFMI